MSSEEEEELTLWSMAFLEVVQERGLDRLEFHSSRFGTSGQWFSCKLNEHRFRLRCGECDETYICEVVSDEGPPTF